jgi:hypothetical protein
MISAMRARIAPTRRHLAVFALQAHRLQQQMRLRVDALLHGAQPN